mgnify:CR=1 FL=1
MYWILLVRKMENGITWLLWQIWEWESNVTALDQIREAVRQEPDNMQYRMLLQRMEGGGGWYQQRQDPFGGMPTAGGDMCDACCRTMACFMCWPGGFFCC